MILMRFNNRDDNLGDRLIFSYLYHELKAYDDIQLYRSAPQDLRITPLRFRQAFIMAVKRIFNKENVVIYYPPGARFISASPEKKSILVNFKDNLQLLSWKIIGVKMYLTGVSIGVGFDPVYYHKFYSVGVRDNSSLLTIKPHHKNVGLCPDMAFLGRPNTPDLSTLKPIISLRRNTPDNHYHNKYEKHLIKALTIIKRTFAENEPITFYAQVDEDIEFNRKLTTDMKQIHKTFFLTGKPENFDFESFFHGYGVVISNRLHVLLPAMTEGLLPIAIVLREHTKIVDLFITHGLEEHLIYIDDIDNIEHEIRQLLASHKVIRTELHKKMIELRTRTKEFLRNQINSET